MNDVWQQIPHWYRRRSADRPMQAHTTRLKELWPPLQPVL
jgi:hypothetical protein